MFDQKYLVNGGSSSSELEVHKKYCKLCTKSIIEIGVLYGDTSRILCESNPSIIVYGIDPIVPDSMNQSLIGNLEKIKINTSSCKNFTFINDYSYNVCRNWSNPFDYIFIDGSHIYEDVKRDFNEWFPILEPGGYISLHDSTANRGGPYWWSGPSQFADELICDNRIEFLESDFTLTVFKKL